MAAHQEPLDCWPIEHSAPGEVFMRLRTYRDQAYAGRIDLIGAGAEPWSVDLVSVAAAMLLVTGFVCAVAAQLY